MLQVEVSSLCSAMGNVPLCTVSQRDGVALGKYSNMPLPHPTLRYLSESPDLHAPRPRCPGLAEEGGGEGGVVGWRRWSEDVTRDNVEGEGWEEGECDMILGLELFHESVSGSHISYMYMHVIVHALCLAHVSESIQQTHVTVLQGYCSLYL